MPRSTSTSGTELTLPRLETRVVLEALSARLPSLRLIPGQTLRFQPNTTFRGPLTLVVQWDT